MHALAKFVAVVALVGIFGASRSVQAAEASSTTTITIDGMTCGGCAKKVAGKLKAVAGVESAKINLEGKSAAVVPASQNAPSPRALWEAVEKAGFTPVKLSGPVGTFTEKPKS